jgi:Transposase
LRRVWAGADIGRDHHHVAVVDSVGERVFSRRVANDETALLGVIGDVLALAEEVTWAIDLNSSESVLLLTLLLDQGQKVVYVPGIVVNRAAEGYRGAGKTDCEDHGRGVLLPVWLKDRSAPCLLGDTSIGEGAPPGAVGRVRRGLIGA